MTTYQKQQIAVLRGKGLSYTRIAAYLSLSENTVKSFCQRHQIEKAQEPVKGNNAVSGFCRNCGMELSVKTGARPKLFCCEKCRRGWWKKNPDQAKKLAVYSLRCGCCEIPFESYGNKTRKYCSHACYIRARFMKPEELMGGKVI